MHEFILQKSENFQRKLLEAWANFAMQVVVVRQVKDEKSKNAVKISSFHQSIGHFIAFSQFFAILPVENVLQADESKLKFSWTSFRTIYALSWYICASIEGIIATKGMFTKGFDVHQVEVLMFFVLSPIRAFLCFHLARHWKKIMMIWRKCEENFLKPPFSEKGWKLTTKARAMLINLILQTFGN